MIGGVRTQPSPAPVSQSAEEAVLNTAQCGFDPHPGHSEPRDLRKLILRPGTQVTQWRLVTPGGPSTETDLRMFRSIYAKADALR